MKSIKDRIVMLDEIGIAGKRCLELGVFKGEYSAEILARKPAELILVDPWRGFDFLTGATLDREDMTSTVDHSNFEQHMRDVYVKYGELPNVHIERGYSHEIVRKVANDCLDFVFIDGNHTFGHCYHDMVAWSAKLKRGGFMAIHDFGGGSLFYGVRQSVNEFCKVTGNEIWGVTEDMWGCAIIQLK